MSTKSARTFICKTRSGIIYRDRYGSLCWEPFRDEGIPTQSEWAEYVNKRTFVREDKFTSNGGRTNSRRHVAWGGKQPMLCMICSESVSWMDAEPVKVGSSTQFVEYSGKDGEYQGERLSLMKWTIVRVQKAACGCKRCQGHMLHTMKQGGHGYMDLTALVVAEAEFIKENKPNAVPTVARTLSSHVVVNTVQKMPADLTKAMRALLGDMISGNIGRIHTDNPDKIKSIFMSVGHIAREIERIEADKAKVLSSKESK